jgi:hypothetical protein
MNNHSEDIQEIICSNCGRPNLPEAVKCWYCQTELNNGEADSLPADETSFAAETQAEKAVQPDPAPAEEAEIPEWLQRIREKEQKERASQDARDQWQQQALFNGSSKPAPARHAKHTEETREIELPVEPAATPTEPVVVEDPLEQTPLAAVKPQEQPKKTKPAVIIDEEDDILPDDSSEDLPEGFVKFDSNDN